MELSPKDLQSLAQAKELLENPGLAARLANALGFPIEKGLSLLPTRWSEMVHDAARVSLSKALDVAVLTLNENPPVGISSEALHKLAVGITGALGGAFGIPALTLELPVSTTLMLRSIADIARSEGERIKNTATKLACLEVFALGGTRTADDAVEAGYFAVRGALARTVSEATKYIMEKGIAEEGAPALVRLIARIAARFSVAVSEKAAAQAVPVIGAAGGALVNTVFMDHYQDMARGHFIIRRLERTYGPELVQEEYALI